MLYALAALLLFTSQSPGPSDVEISVRPSVVVVFIDDMGYGDLGCFGGVADTPAIDRLAREGRRFEHFYVNSPICSPSRVALTTGQWPARHRITSYLARREANAERGIADWLDPGAPTLPRLLQADGYATGHFGKWHMGGQRDVGDAPAIGEYGFDASLTNFEGLGPRVLPLCYSPGEDEPRRHGLGSGQLGRGPIRWVDRATLTTEFVDGALEFIRDARERGAPFYVNVWPDDVHTPLHPPLDAWPTGVDGDELRAARYVAVLEALDRQLAPLFDDLRAAAEGGERSLVVLCSDNGHEPGCGVGGGLSGCKATLFEGGIRSPLVAWGPGLVETGVDSASVFSALDLVPALLELTGTATPDGVRWDGEDVSTTLLGRGCEGREAPLYFRRPPDREDFRGYEGLPDLAVRSGRWKLMCEFDGSAPRLFDVVADPGETRDLASQEVATTKRLTDAVVAWNRDLPQDAASGAVASGSPSKGH